MKQLYRLLLPLLALGSLLPACSPRAYSGFLAPPAAGAVRPVLAAATVVAPLAAPSALPLVRLAQPAPALARTVPAGQPPLVEAARRIAAIAPKTLSLSQLPQPVRLRPRPRTIEVAGTPTGVEGLGEAMLKIALLLIVFFVLVWIAVALLVKLIIHLAQKSKRPKP